MWIDVGRRDVRLAGGIETLDREPPAPAGRCSVPGCQRAGEHEGMCGRHFWRSTQMSTQIQAARSLDGARWSPAQRSRLAQLAEAYVLAAGVIERAPLCRWAQLTDLLREPESVRRRVRTILSIASGRPGLQVDTAERYRIRVSDRQDAADSLAQAVLETHYWRQAVIEAGLLGGERP